MKRLHPGMRCKKTQADHALKFDWEEEIKCSEHWTFRFQKGNATSTSQLCFATNGIIGPTWEHAVNLNLSSGEFSEGAQEVLTIYEDIDLELEHMSREVERRTPNLLAYESVSVGQTPMNNKLQHSVVCQDM